MIVINTKLFKPGNSYANQANANIAELKKILTGLTVKDSMVPEPKQHPSPDWINGRKQGGTVWAREERRKPKTFKL
jgi:hypothetical protein